jgi:hypothetical protein
MTETTSTQAACAKCSRQTKDGHRLCGRCWGAEREIAAHASGRAEGYGLGWQDGRTQALGEVRRWLGRRLERLRGVQP